MTHTEKMNCPKCKSPLPSYLVDSREAGRKGGKTTGPSKARTSEQARAAVMKRWEKKESKKLHREIDDSPRPS